MPPLRATAARWRATLKGRAAAAVVLAWLVPGAGHAFLGRRERGLVFFAALGALFLMGLAMDARLVVYAGFEDPLALLRSGAQIAMGLPYLAARLLGFGLDAGLVTSPSHEYGSTFTEVAGLLNVLVMLDAFDVAAGRKP